MKVTLNLWKCNIIFSNSWKQPINKDVPNFVKKVHTLVPYVDTKQRGSITSKKIKWSATQGQ